MKDMTSKKNMSSNRTPRRIDRNAGGRKKGVLTSLIKKHYGNKKKKVYDRDMEDYYGWFK
jgi:hypothetical protein